MSESSLIEVPVRLSELQLSLSREEAEAFMFLIIASVKSMQLERNRAKFKIAVFREQEEKQLEIGERVIHALGSYISEHRVEGITLEVQLGEVKLPEAPDKTFLRV